MRLRVTCALAVAVAFAASLPAQSAAGPTPQITDVADDANFVNGQGAENGPPGTPTGDVSVSDLDILSATFRSYGRTVVTVVRGKRVRSFVPDGFRITVVLAAPPEQSWRFYRVRTWAPACNELYFHYGTSPSFERTSVSYKCGQDTSSSATKLPPAQVVGNALVFTVPISKLPKGVGVGTVLSRLRVETRSDVAGVTAGQADEAYTSLTYRIGS